MNNNRIKELEALLKEKNEAIAVIGVALKRAMEDLEAAMTIIHDYEEKIKRG